MAGLSQLSVDWMFLPVFAKDGEPPAGISVGWAQAPMIEGHRRKVTGLCLRYVQGL
jgi:hypothetical protein